MSKGIVFNIQKFSIHDGPGIRTTVFLKGCPLRCRWCSNPESQLPGIQILYDKSKCLRCRACEHICPAHAITFTETAVFIDFNRCSGCLSCVHACPGHALSNEGEEKDIQAIVSICLQDKDFYEESGGGVTISGGEGMSQPDFLLDLVKELKKERLHLAIETTGYVEPRTFQTLAAFFDLLLFDVKHYDSAIHKAQCGVPNEPILQNLHWAIRQHKNVLPRIPVIPGFNDTLYDAEKLSDLLLEAGAQQVQLLPFHQFGEKKYELLNRPYAMKNVKALHKEDLGPYQDVFHEKGLNCFF